MSTISKNAKHQIYQLIEDVVAAYIKKAVDKPKADSGNPFVMALLKDFDPLLHRIHGMKTSMGSQMEKMAQIIARESWGQENVRRKVRINVELPTNVFQTIDSIMNGLGNAERLSNYEQEKALVKAACKSHSTEIQSYTYEFDLELFDERASHYHYLEMKGPDPNTTEVPGAKRRLLAVLGWSYMNHKSSDVDIRFAIYYNNKHPKPYKNPKVHYYFNPDGGTIVQEAFWNFLGKDERTYSELLKLFAEFGMKNKNRIWNSFSKLIRVA